MNNSTKESGIILNFKTIEQFSDFITGMLYNEIEISLSHYPYENEYRANILPVLERTISVIKYNICFSEESCKNILYNIISKRLLKLYGRCDLIITKDTFNTMFNNPKYSLTEIKNRVIRKIILYVTDVHKLTLKEIEQSSTYNDYKDIIDVIKENNYLWTEPLF